MTAEADEQAGMKMVPMNHVNRPRNWRGIKPKTCTRASGYLTLRAVRTGHQAESIIARREQVLQTAFQAHPERFVNGPPKPPTLPKEVFINRPHPRAPTGARHRCGARKIGSLTAKKSVSKSLTSSEIP